MSADLGIDRSGNNNHWTVNNMTLAADQMVDSPTNNFATLNSIAGGTNSAFSEGNLKNVGTVSSFSKAYCTIPITSGKWYTELCGVNVANNAIQVGITSVNPIRSNSNQNGEESGTSFYGLYNSGRSGGYIFNDASATNSLTRANDDDIIGIAFDADAGNVKYYINNTLVGSASGYSPTNVSGTFWFCLITRDVGSSVINFGQDSSFAGAVTAQGNQDSNGIGDFYYEPPTDFLALCTSNLPDVAVTPSEHFNTILYTGNGGTPSHTGVGFQPDLVWTKGRSTTHYNLLFDSVRGATEVLRSEVNNAEYTQTDSLVSFDSDGFSTEEYSQINTDTETYVAWNWKAATTASGTTTGSGTGKSYSAQYNTDAGFSIISYEGNGTAGHEIPHHLSATLDFWVVKRRPDTDHWFVGHSGLASDYETDYLILSLNEAKTDSDDHWDDTKPTSSVFTCGGTDDVNGDTVDYIAYCFHSVDGYSKVGSYTGNGDDDGTFIYTGFRPAFLIVKAADVASKSWLLFDNKRNTSNPIQVVLYPDTTAAEETFTSEPFDFTSNGFKSRKNSSKFNGSGSTYIYLAFAETPFKYSNAR